MIRFIQRIYWGTFVTLISMQFRRDFDAFIYANMKLRDDFCLLQNSNFSVTKLSDKRFTILCYSKFTNSIKMSIKILRNDYLYIYIYILRFSD